MHLSPLSSYSNKAYRNHVLSSSPDLAIHPIASTKINHQEAYDSLLEDCGKYAKVANLTMKKMKKVEEEHRCILVQHKEAKCEVEKLKGELVEGYSKIKFLELEIVQANVKVECISTKKLDNVLSSQKSSHDKIGLGYTKEGSLSSERKKEVKFVSTKNVKKLKEVKLEI